MTLDEFRYGFPEFSEVSDEQISLFLANAATRMHADTFGDSYDAAHGYLTAHMLSASPMGNTAKLDKDKGITRYLLEYRSIRRERVPTPVAT